MQSFNTLRTFWATFCVDRHLYTPTETNRLWISQHRLGPVMFRFNSLCLRVQRALGSKVAKGKDPASQLESRYLLEIG